MGTDWQFGLPSKYPTVRSGTCWWRWCIAMGAKTNEHFIQPIDWWKGTWLQLTWTFQFSIRFWHRQFSFVFCGFCDTFQMEYLVRFADGVETMVALTFGPMKKLIKAYEKQQAKPSTTDDKVAKKKDRKKSTVIVCWNLTKGHWDQMKNGLIGFVCLFIFIPAAKSR